MTCRLLCVVAQPAARPYDDPNVKDVIGSYPQVFCRACWPGKQLSAAETVRCFERDEPCLGVEGRFGES